MNHLLSSHDLTRSELLTLLIRAKDFLAVLRERRKLTLAEGKILATLFYEPSTRTRFSFETAMLRLGGMVISNSQMDSTSSAKKGETLYDTGRVVSQMADIMVMRHYQEGSVAELAKGATVPVINGGDGAGDHPTQGLLDLFTIQEHFGRLEGLKIAMVGDLKNSRVLHSQCAYLAHFPGNSFTFVSPEGLRMPMEITAGLRARGFEVNETENFAEAVKSCDVLSHTRIQKERFMEESEYLKYKGVYVLTPDLMRVACEDMIVLHPLPRVDEIDPEVDKDPRACYFKQVENGVAVRMALLATLLGL